MKFAAGGGREIKEKERKPVSEVLKGVGTELMFDAQRGKKDREWRCVIRLHPKYANKYKSNLAVKTRVITAALF